MEAKYILGLTVCGIMLLAAGCRKNAADKSAFKSVINNYYEGRQECVWPNPVKFPAQADVSKEDQTKGFDALTDAGFLVRKPVEKKRFLIGSKQVNDYDLSAKGRSIWTADQTQPGYGNFCFGHRSVTIIDNYTPANNSNATQYTVTYHYNVVSVPDWANTTEMKTAFPRIRDDASGQQTATATLTKTNNGWKVVNVQPSSDKTSSNP